jgi:hypothetical protein
MDSALVAAADRIASHIEAAMTGRHPEKISDGFRQAGTG